MPKVATEKRSEKTSGWGNGQLFGTEANENTFQGAGFKDKEKALETIRLLKGRDTTYQYQIINSMFNRAKVILKRTTDKEKKKNLTESIETFEEWIDDYKKNSRSKDNFNYLPVELIEDYQPLAAKYGVEEKDFLKAYKEADGDMKKLRARKVEGKDITWDVERNDRLKEVAKTVKDKEILLFETEEPLKGLPTKEHTHMIMLAYSSDQSKIKKCVPMIKEKLDK